MGEDRESRSVSGGKEKLIYLGKEEPGLIFVLVS